MSTSVVNVVSHFPSAENGFTTTTSGSVSSGATTVGLNSVAGYANGEVVVFVIDPTDAAKKQTFTGTIDTAGVQVTDVVWTAGTNQTHALGATVVDYATATHISMMTKGIRVSLGQDGHIATTGVATFTDHIDVEDAKSIRDENNNELITFSQTASAVNELTVKNAATGNGPEIQATGGDTDIDVELVPKGAGNVTNGTYPIDWWEEIGRTTLSGAGDTITVSGLPARKYLKILFSVNATGGNIAPSLRFNNDSGSNYSRRAYLNDTMSTTLSTTGCGPGFTAAATPIDCEVSVINVATKEKFCMGNAMHWGASGAATAPSNALFYVKWVNTSDQITTVALVNTSTGDFTIGSEVVVLGHD